MRKRMISILALVLLLTSLLPVVGASALIGPQYVNTSNGKGVNLRVGPSKGDEILTTIPFGAMVDSYTYYNNSWGFVSYHGYYGYAMSRYFSSTKPTSKPNPSPSGGGTGNLYKGFTKTDYYAVVRPSTPSGYVNLRWAPSKSQAIEGTYYAGYTLHVIAQNKTWAQVIDEATGTCGFMMLSFLNTTGVGAEN